SRVKDIALPISFRDVDLTQIDLNPVRCPHEETAKTMFNFIDEVRKSGNTVGGEITCLAQGVPVGWGEPVFDKLHADLGKAMLSINAVKGFEYGSGFEGSRMLGTEHNDQFVQTEQGVETLSNHSGGIQGGISNGADINMNIAFKPVATIMQAQESIDKDGNVVEVQGKGRHDPCVLPRAVPIVEAMARLVLADHFLRSKTSKI
ncbi:MAG: chorismate synthase, partial [Flavobacteriales bacterium]